MKYVKGRFTFLAPSRRKNKKYDVFYTRDNKYITSFICFKIDFFLQKPSIYCDV